MAHIGTLTTATLAAMITVIGLSGCSAAVPETPSSAEPTSATPAIDPGPVTLTDEEAAERYLSIVCPINIATGALYDAYKAGEDEYLNGGAPDVSAVVDAATIIRDSQRVAIEQLDETYFVWPELVAAQIPHIRSAYMANMAVVSSTSTSTTFEAAYRIPEAPETPEEQAAGQEIRYQLAISADTDASCVGHEDGLNVLSAEKLERDTALAEQD